MGKKIPLTLDCMGLRCPLPVLKARKVMRDLQGEQSLRVLVDDPGAPDDFKALGRKDGWGVDVESMGEGCYAVTLVPDAASGGSLG